MRLSTPLPPRRYLATSTDSSGVLGWAVDKDVAGGADASINFDVDTLRQCVGGSCFVVDFHLDLGGEAAGSRTTLGNPQNAPKW